VVGRNWVSWIKLAIIGRDRQTSESLCQQSVDLGARIFL
jgi:hypothetical protein